MLMKFQNLYLVLVISDGQLMELLQLSMLTLILVDVEN